VNFLAFAAFIATSIYSYKAMHPNYYNPWMNRGWGGQQAGGGYYGGGGYGGGGGGDWNSPEAQYMRYNSKPTMKSSSMVFASVWTALMCTFLGLFGMIVMGRICTKRVNNTTKLGLGIFIGALVMFANMLLVSAALFGEFQVDSGSSYMNEEQMREMGMWQMMRQGSGFQKCSNAFSLLCVFLALVYSCFGILLFLFKETLIEEMEMEDCIEDELECQYQEHLGKSVEDGVPVSANNSGLLRVPSLRKNGSNVSNNGNGIQRTNSNGSVQSKTSVNSKASGNSASKASTIVEGRKTIGTRFYIPNSENMFS